MNDASIERALARGRTSTTRWCAIVGRHPHETHGLRRRRHRARSSEAAARSAGARDRRDRPRLLPRPRPARGPAARVRGAGRARRARRHAAGDPHARGRGRHASPSCASTRPGCRGDHALLLGAGRGWRSASSGATCCSFAGNVTYPKAADLRPPRARCPRSCCWWRPTRPTWRRSPCAGKPNEPANVVAHGALRRRAARRVLRRSSSARWRRTPRGCSGGEREPSRPGQPAPPARVRRPAEPRARPELPDRRQHPRRDRPGRRARPGRRGARGGRRAGRAVGVPGPAGRAPARRRGGPRRSSRRSRTRSSRSERHAPPGRRGRGSTWPRSTPRARQGRREPALRGGGHRAAASRSPELPGATLWVAMVQREVGERLAAAPGTPRPTAPLGARPALVRRARAAQGARAPSSTRCRTWTPRWSSCAAARAAPPDGGRDLVHAAFAHRRKALAGSLALAPGAPRGMRDARPRRARGDRPCPPTPAPSGSRRRTGRASPDALGRERLADPRPRSLPR